MWGRVAQTLATPPEHRPPIGQPQAVVWRGRVFTTSAGLRAYLDSKGVDYGRWIALHPAAIAVLRHTPAPSKEVANQPKPTADAPAKTATSKGHQQSQSQKARASTKSPATIDVSGSTSRSLSGLLKGLLAIVACLLVLSAIIPPFRLPMWARRVYRSPELRLGAVSVGVAIVLGLLMSSYL